MLEQEVSGNDEDLAEQAEEKREGGHRRSSATADGAAARRTPTKTNRIPSARPELICSCRKSQAEIGTINLTMLCTARAIPTGIVLRDWSHAAKFRTLKTRPIQVAQCVMGESGWA